MDYFVQYDEQGAAVAISTLEAQATTAQEGMVQVEEADYLQAKAQIEAQGVTLHNQRMERLAAIRIDQFLEGKSPERAALSWICEKLGINEETAKAEIKATYEQRKATRP